MNRPPFDRSNLKLRPLAEREHDMALDDGLMLEANHFGLLSSTADMREGMTAFLEKRRADFQGR